MSNGRKFIFVALVLLVFWAISAPLAARRLIVEKKIDNPDVIFVLSGSAVYLERTEKAAELYRAKVSEKMLLSDDGGKAGWSQAEERNPKFVELAQKSLVENGVDQNAIFILDANVTGTIYEAKAFLKEARRSEWKSVLVVTSAFHTRRALNTFEDELSGSGIEVGITSPPEGRLTPSSTTWWLTPNGWTFVAGEYLKSWYYWLFY